jgi:uncharacterized membrane protein YadS
VAAVVVAAVATVLGKCAPVVGGPVFAIVLGVLLAAAIPALRAPRLKPGLTFASKPVLQTSIVVLGTGLSLGQVAQVGGQSLPVMLGTLVIALGGAWLLGRALNVRGDTQTLIGVGTGICGASAIAATTDEVSLMAVPLHSPNACGLIPIRWPSGGKSSTAAMLKVKIVPMA